MVQVKVKFLSQTNRLFVVIICYSSALPGLAQFTLYRTETHHVHQRKLIWSRNVEEKDVVIIINRKQSPDLFFFGEFKVSVPEGHTKKIKGKINVIPARPHSAGK